MTIHKLVLAACLMMGSAAGTCTCSPTRRAMEERPADRGMVPGLEAVARSVDLDSVPLTDPIANPESSSHNQASDRGDVAKEDEVLITDRSVNHCEGLRLTFKNDRPRYRRIRKQWTKADMRRFSSLVTLVSKEMGADPRIFLAWSMRESSYRPHAIHVLDPDIEAATAVYQRFRYSAAKESELRQLMESSSARDPEYWKARARLVQIQTFRDNTFFESTVPLDVVAPDGTVSKSSEHAWAFGYGAFGFNPSYYVPVWDSKSPPWIFCEDDGLVAIITAIWVARSIADECESQGFDRSYAMVNRRFSRGHCGAVDPESKFFRRAESLGLDPYAEAQLGSRWPSATTDRNEIRAHMRSRAIELGLLEPIGER